MITIARWMDFSKLLVLDPTTGHATRRRVRLRELGASAAGITEGAFDVLGGHLIAGFGCRVGPPYNQSAPPDHLWLHGTVHRARDVVAEVTGPTGRLGLTVRRLRLGVRGSTVLETRYVPGRTAARLLGRDEWGIGGDDYDFGALLAQWFPPRDTRVAI